MTVASIQQDMNPIIIERADLDHLFHALARRGYQIVGSTLRDGAIVYDQITSVDDLPAGWTDEQTAGSYRLKRRDDGALFGYAVGPHSWKKISSAAGIEALARRKAPTTGSPLRKTMKRFPAMRLSRCAPASLMPSPFKTGYF